MAEEGAFWLAWSQIPKIGPILLRRLQLYFGSLSAAWEASPAELAQVEGFGDVIIKTVVRERSQLNPEQLLQQHRLQNPYFWTPVDPEYPRLLLETPSPPPLLYYRGKIDPCENQGMKPLVGIVGTRHPTEYGRRWTRKISTALAKNGFTVVSGMAKGIDTTAHLSCLEAGGRTIAVVGTGVDVVYPAENRTLYEQIQQQGLVVSEYPGGTQPKREHFPPRNRIIAGLSRAVLVIEASSQSGALITAHYANEFCRDVYVLPGRLDDHQSQGCLQLLNQGAAQIPRELDELLKSLGAIPKLDSAEQLELFTQPSLPDLTPELKQVFEAIPSEPTSFDAIVQQAKLSAGAVSGSLLQLELMGLVTQLPGMRYHRG